jgi:hypothetical protein
MLGGDHLVPPFRMPAGVIRVLPHPVIAGLAAIIP